MLHPAAGVEGDMWSIAWSLIHRSPLPNTRRRRFHWCCLLVPSAVEFYESSSAGFYQPLARDAGQSPIFSPCLSKWTVIDGIRSGAGRRLGTIGLTRIAEDEQLVGNHLGRELRLAGYLGNPVTAAQLAYD